MPYLVADLSGQVAETREACRLGLWPGLVSMCRRHDRLSTVTIANAGGAAGGASRSAGELP